MDKLFDTVLELSWQAGLIALAVMAVRLVLRKKASRRALCMLWALVALRLLLAEDAAQAAALARAAELCEAALYAAQSGMTPDAVVMDAEGAITALGEITGETVTDAVVTRIFSDFCVGK